MKYQIWEKIKKVPDTQLIVHAILIMNDVTNE